MFDLPGVTRCPVTPLSGQEATLMKDFRDFYTIADLNGDKKLTQEELETYQQIEGILLFLAQGDPAKERAYHEKSDRFLDSFNVLSTFWDQLDSNNRGFVPLSTMEELAQKYQRPESLWGAVLG